MNQCVREKESLYKLELREINEVIEGFYMTDHAVKSYFESETERNYLTEYHFETLPQLRELLSEMWKHEDYMQNELKTLLAAAMKNKPLREDGIVKQNKSEETMPVFIYAF